MLTNGGVTAFVVGKKYPFFTENEEKNTRSCKKYEQQRFKKEAYLTGMPHIILYKYIKERT